MLNSVYWLIILAVLILIEIITLGLTAIWFAAGALAAFIASLFLENLIIEVIVFAGFSLSLLYFIRPMFIKSYHPGKKKSDYEGVIGKSAVVDITIDNLKLSGKVNVEGREWAARSLEGNIIEKGTRVRILGISGTKLVVSTVRSREGAIS